MNGTRLAKQKVMVLYKIWWCDNS